MNFCLNKGLIFFSKNRREKKQQELAEKFSKKMTRDVSRLGDDFFKNYKTWNNEKKKETMLKIVKSIDSGKEV